MQFTPSNRLSLLLLIALLTACGAPAPEPPTDREPEMAAPDLSAYPADFQAVLAAHGGLAAWQEHRQLSYGMARGEATERQTIDIHDRRERISQPARTGGGTVEMGFDGQRTWVLADTSYRGDPMFYRNLMFYFYAMPWVLADPGINYAAAEPLTYDGQTYPGILVSYDDGIGFSPKDNYRLHYDPATKKMRWLGYTVTGRSGEASDKFSWIEYPTWTSRGGAELPDSLVWYVVEDNQPIEPRNTRTFDDVKLSKSTPDDEQFAPPAGARVVDGE